MTLSADDVNTIKELIVDPLAKKIDAIHAPGTCNAISDLKNDMSSIAKKVDDVKGQQKYFMGIFSAVIFIFTFFRDAILGWFRK